IKVSPVTLTKAPLVKQGQRRNPVLESPKSKMRSVLRLTLSKKSWRRIAPGGELLAAPWASGGELLATPWALRVSARRLATAEATPLQNSRKTKPAEIKMLKAINGQLLAIGHRSTTVAAATS